jgi:hypothetical protein
MLLFDLSKGFVGIYINRSQAKDLMNWLKKELEAKV